MYKKVVFEGISQQTDWISVGVPATPGSAWFL
jgi:hypothetical protein